MVSQREYQTFVRNMRAIDRAAKRERLKASKEGRTLELGSLGRSIARKTPLNLIEYGAEQKYSVSQLKRFDSRRRAVERTFKSTGLGIDAILAQVRPFPTFSVTSDKRSSDIAKARRLPRPDFVSMRKDTLHFRVRSENPDPKRGISHYLTSIRLLDLEQALRTPPNESGRYLPSVQQALKGGIQIHCGCGRYRFWYSYKSTVAGAAIKPERGFPKIRNPKLSGLACGHLIVTLNYLKSSGVLHKILADRFAKLADRPFGKKGEEFATGKEEKKQRKARVDRRLAKVDKAKETFKSERAKKSKEKERLNRIASAQERQRQRRARKAQTDRKQKESEDKKKFDQQQRDVQALQKKLAAEEKKRAAAEEKLKKQQVDQDLEIVRQVVKTLRQAGLSDEQIKANELVRQSKVDLSTIK